MSSCLYLVLLLATFSGSALSLSCFCFESFINPPGFCVNGTEVCDPGVTHCYYRRQYEESFAPGFHIIVHYGCLSFPFGNAGFLRQVCVDGVDNSDRNEWKCCNSSDQCNLDLTITLPIELGLETTQSTVTSDVLGITHPDNLDQPNTNHHDVIIIVVGVCALAFGVIVFLSLTFTGLVLRYRGSACSQTIANSTQRQHTAYRKGYDEHKYEERLNFAETALTPESTSSTTLSHAQEEQDGRDEKME